MKLFILGILLFVGSFFPVYFSQYSYPLVSSLAIVLLALPSYYFLCKHDLKKGLCAIGAISVFAILIETIGIYTGFPYSFFTYSESLGGKLFGVTPWTVFFAFTPLVLGAIRLADIVFKRTTVKILTAISILVLVDLILDPVAVALGFWIWQTPGMYYGIPFVNFIGWIFSGSIALAIYYLFYKTKTIQQQETSLILSLWFWSGASFFLQFWIPFCIGIVLLGTYYAKNKSFYKQRAFKRTHGKKQN